MTTIIFHFLHCYNIDGLQSIPRESNGKDMAAMLDELTIETIMRNFLLSSLQHDGGYNNMKTTIFIGQQNTPAKSQQPVPILKAITKLYSYIYIYIYCNSTHNVIG